MRKKADNKTMRERLENSWVFYVVLLLLPIVLLGIRELWRYRYCDQCLENWGNEKFISYTGQCTEVYFDSGFEGFARYGWLSKRGYQDFTGQGWHLILDNGRGYYIPECMEREMPLCNTDSLNALVGKEVTVLCLPETAVPSMNLMVYLESGGECYVTEDASQRNLRQAIEAIPGKMGVLLLAFSPIWLLALVNVYFAVDGARNRREKERCKQENIRRLRDADLLHPKNQRRRKERNGK